MPRGKDKKDKENKKSSNENPQTEAEEKEKFIEFVTELEEENKKLIEVRGKIIKFVSVEKGKIVQEVKVIKEAIKENKKEELDKEEDFSEIKKSFSKTKKAVLTLSKISNKIEENRDKIEELEELDKRKKSEEFIKSVETKSKLPSLESILGKSLLDKINKAIKLDIASLEAVNLRVLTDNLGNYLGQINDIYVKYDKESDEAKLLFDLYKKISSKSDKVYKAKREKRNVTAANTKGIKKERIVGKIKFTGSSPKLAEPTVGGKPLPGVKFLAVTIAGKKYHLYSGQSFLNYKRSTELYKKPPSKSGNIEMMLGDHLFPKSKKGEYKNLILSDAHHRFLFGIHHGKTLKAEIKPEQYIVIGGEKPCEWKAMMYKHHPKHIYKFGKDKFFDQRMFYIAISPLSACDPGTYEKNKGVFIDKHLGAIWTKKYGGFYPGPGELKKLQSYVDGLIKVGQPRPYDEFVKDLVKRSKNQEFAKGMGELLLKSPPKFKGTSPNVAYGDADSVGYYNNKYHVIVLDPKKNPTADALLDTLAFETGNANRKEDFDKGGSKTEVEFGTMKSYIDMLMKAAKVKDIDGLVEALKIPKEYLKEANAKKVLSMDTPALDMPKISEQKIRSALAWWKMKKWSEEERKQYFGQSAHAEGMEATNKEYKKK